MKCSSCSKKAVYSSQGRSYCKDHFLNYFERKIFRTIRKFSLIQHKDKICIATSGGKDSLAVLYMTMLYCKKYKIDFFALNIDEGIADYRDHTINDLKIFCKKYDIPYHIVSFKERFGFTLDELIKKGLEKGKKPCTVCGILRRTLLNRGARELGATKLVTGHNLDDESQAYLMNLFLGNMRHNAALGPATGLSTNSKFVPRIKPLYFISEKETRLFALLKGFEVHFSECPNIELSFRAKVRDKLNELELLRQGAKNGVVNAFLEILPTLKQKYKNTKEFSYCARCSDPCAGEVCNACILEQELCQNKN